VTVMHGYLLTSKLTKKVYIGNVDVQFHELVGKDCRSSNSMSRQHSKAQSARAIQIEYSTREGLPLITNRSVVIKCKELLLTSSIRFFLLFLFQRHYSTSVVLSR
jgi:hypothetical protein